MAACGDKNQSAIQEVRDQLFLDTADGGRLNAVTGNLGMDRPGPGFDDDEWRAVAKLVALQPKQVRNAFYRMIELCLGPQYARIGTLASATLFADRQLSAVDATSFVQLGTLLIDPTLATEETIDYCFRDVTTGEFLLPGPLQFAHAVIAPGADRLRTTALAAATSLLLINSSKLPTAGFPYPVMVDRGLPTEEIVKVTANNTGTNTLTIAAPGLLHDHLGPATLFLRTTLGAATIAKRTFVKLPANATRKFPPTGWIRVAEGGAGDEVVEYVENDATDSVLFLRTPLANAHLAGVSVELVNPGASVEVAQLVELGVHWTLFETEPRRVIVQLPAGSDALRLLDASWLHSGATPTAPSTVAVATAAPDTIVQVASVSTFPDSGNVDIGAGPQHAFYTLRLAQADVAATVTSATLLGAKTLPYTRTSDIDFPSPVDRYRVIVNRGGPRQERIDVLVTNSVAGVLNLATPAAFAHLAGDAIELVEQILLDKPIGAIYAPGAAVTPVVITDGNYRDIFGAIILNHFPGGYLFDILQRGVSAINTQLSVAVPPETTVASAQGAGRTNIEVVDASLWPAPPFTARTVRIGALTGLQEDRNLVDRTLRTSATATVIGPTLAGITSMNYTLTSVGEFPESDGVHPAGYRVRIGAGTANDETVYINQNSVGPHTFTFLSALVNPHANGESIQLLHDVLTTDTLVSAHSGPTVSPSRIGETVQLFISELTVSPAPTNFPSVGGTVWINFGKEIINVRKRITIITDPTHYTLATSFELPTSGYPYQVVLGDGRAAEERVFVTNNNTGTGELTFAAPGALNAHTVGDYAAFYSGEPEVIDYNAKATGPDRLTFSTPQILATRHLVGERVIYSPGLSESKADGSSFGFKMPPDPGACLATLFDFVRAAGIEVIIRRP